MKSKVLITLLLAGSVALTGCSEEKKEEIKEEIKQEIKQGTEEIKNVFDVKMEFESYLDYRDELIEKDVTLYEELVAGYYESEEPMEGLKVLRKVTAGYEALAEEARNKEIKTEEVQAVHNGYVELLDATIEALKDYEKGYLDGDDELIYAADEKMEQVFKMGEEKDAALMKVAEDYRIDLELVEE